METINKIKKFQEKDKIDREFLDKIEIYFTKKFGEVSTQVFVDTKSMEYIIEKWKSVKKNLLLENYFSNPILDYGNKERLGTLTLPVAISLGYEYVSNCMIIVWLDSFFEIYKMPDSQNENNILPCSINTKDFRDRVFASLQPYFDKTEHSDLKNLLEGKNNIRKITFKDKEAQYLVWLFKLLHDNNKMERNKKRIANWICYYFSYFDLDKAQTKQFDFKYVYRKMKEKPSQKHTESLIDVVGLRYS